MLAGKCEPLGGFRIGCDDVGAVVGLDGVAVGAGGVCFLPGAYPVAEDLEAVVLDQPAFCVSDRRFPLPLSLGFFSLPSESALFGYGRLEFEFAE
jgi:hypothetical protein